MASPMAAPTTTRPAEEGDVGVVSASSIELAGAPGTFSIDGANAPAFGASTGTGAAFGAFAGAVAAFSSVGARVGAGVTCSVGEEAVGSAAVGAGVACFVGGEAVGDAAVGAGISCFVGDEAVGGVATGVDVFFAPSMPGGMMGSETWSTEIWSEFVPTTLVK